MRRRFGDLGRAAWLVLAAYLTATAPAAVLAGGQGGALGWVAPAHLTALVGAIFVAFSTREHTPPVSRPRWLDWGPLVAMTILYGELPALMAGAAGSPAAVVYHDATIQHVESALFGASPAMTLASQLPGSLSGLLHGAYLAYYAIIFVPPLILFSRRNMAPSFQTTILGLTAAFAACFVVFAYWPVEGPRYAWPPPPGMPTGAIRTFTLRILTSGSSRGAAFPSSHVAVAITQAVLALKYQRRVGIATTALALLLATGAVYGGFHYGTDVVAGATLGLLVSAAALLYARAPRSLLSISTESDPLDPETA